MATAPIAALVLQWGDETAVTLDWTAEPPVILDDGDFDFSDPDNAINLPLV